MKNAMSLLKEFTADESGATAIEYGLIAALVAMGMVTGAAVLGMSIDQRYTSVAGEIAP